MSGICLAQAGLGVVHGLAAALGARFPIAHGIACGATLAAGVEANIAALESRSPAGQALERYAVLGRLLSRLPEGTPPAQARRALVELLRSWAGELRVPGLGAFGVAPGDLAAIVADSRGSSMRTNPVVLADDEVLWVLRESL
ncbi:MAG TPA: iron-containing alcohol dehydrogenase [Candidatus Dormibacteraeota bacterium]|nr:iron-containing alcohol dehydrogenase [Candidatus Dormibacteraeota bacterium]